MRGLRRVCQPFLDGDDPSDVVWAGGKGRLDAGNSVQWVGWTGTDWIDVKSALSEFSLEPEIEGR